MPKIDFENIIFHWPRWIWHLLFWAVFITFFSIVYGSFNEEYALQFQIQLTDAVVQIPAVYLTLYWLMPQFLFKEQYGKFFIYLIVLILAFSTLAWFDSLYIQKPLFWPEEVWDVDTIEIGKILKYTTKIYPVVVLAVVIKWFKYGYIQQKNTVQLAEEKLQAELKFLKAQVHPHFLFNTLNNLYALTLKQSKDAPDMVLKLSELLNYMLYECNADVVELRKELKLVKDYIDLEKIRYGDRLNVSYDVKGEDEGIRIAPLIILPFVENAFKHGVSDVLEESWVSIDLELKPASITLKVENSKSNLEDTEDQFEYKEGIGLTNVKRRLELLYPNQYEFEIHESESSYLVVLKLFF